MATATDLSTPDFAWASQVARSVARRLAPLWDIDDLEQVARIAVWQARQYYDPARNDNFRLYALPYVRGAVLMLVRKEYRDKHHLSINPDGPGIEQLRAGLGNDQGNGGTAWQDFTWDDRMGGDAPPMEQWIDGDREAAELRRAIAKLPMLQRRLVALIAMGYSGNEASRKLGLKLWVGFRLKQKAFEQLRREMRR